MQINGDGQVDGLKELERHINLVNKRHEHEPSPSTTAPSTAPASPRTSNDALQLSVKKNEQGKCSSTAGSWKAVVSASSFWVEFGSCSNNENILMSTEQYADLTPQYNILAATHNKLIEVLTNSRTADKTLEVAYLMTFRTFATPSQVLDTLIERYNVPEYSTANSDKSTIQCRVLQLITKWVSEGFAVDFSGTPLLKQLTSFIDSISPSSPTGFTIPEDDVVTISVPTSPSPSSEISRLIAELGNTIRYKQQKTIARNASSRSMSVSHLSQYPPRVVKITIFTDSTTQVKALPVLYHTTASVITDQLAEKLDLNPEQAAKYRLVVKLPDGDEHTCNDDTQLYTVASEQDAVFSYMKRQAEELEIIEIVIAGLMTTMLISVPMHVTCRGLMDMIAERLLLSDDTVETMTLCVVKRDECDHVVCTLQHSDDVVMMIKQHGIDDHVVLCNKGSDEMDILSALSSASVSRPFAIERVAQMSSLAMQLTYHEFNMYSAIQPQELLDNVYSKAKSEANAPDVVAIIHHFNCISNWVISTILEKNTPKTRAMIMCKYIQLAVELLNLNNFNTLMAIMASLDSIYIVRLSKSFDLVPSTLRKTLLTLERLMSSKSSYKLYRQELARRSKTSPCIPYLGVVLNDLITVDEGNPSFIQNGKYTLINFRKRLMISQLILSIRKFQKFSYSNIEPNHAMIKYIDSLDDVSFTSMSLMKRSIDLEAPSDPSLIDILMRDV